MGRVQSAARIPFARYTERMRARSDGAPVMPDRRRLTARGTLPLWAGLLAIVWAALATVGPARVASAQTAATVGPGETEIVGGVTVTNASGQPANVQLADGILDVALPIGFAVTVLGAECMPVVPAPNFARCRAVAGAQVTLTLRDGQPPPAPAPAPPPPAPPSPFPQPPMAVPRAGTGLDAEGEQVPWILLGLGGAAIALTATGTAVRRSARPRWRRPEGR